MTLFLNKFMNIFDQVINFMAVLAGLFLVRDGHCLTDPIKNLLHGLGRIGRHQGSDISPLLRLRNIGFNDVQRFSSMFSS